MQILGIPSFVSTPYQLKIKQFDVKYEIRIWRNHSWVSLNPITEFWWNDQLTLLAFVHCEKCFIPSFDHLPDLESDRLISHYRTVEHLTIHQRSIVMSSDGLAHLWAGSSLSFFDDHISKSGRSLDSPWPSLVNIFR